MHAPTFGAESVDASTMSGPGTRADGMFLTYFGCDAMGASSSAPGTRINIGPAAAPLGRRSFGLVPTGAGTASGPTLSFSSLRKLDAAVDVRSSTGTTGASFIWVASIDAPPGHAWRGRASLGVAAASWQHVDVSEARYDWQLVDLASGRAAEGGSATPAEFARAHGDGAGYVAAGFGCDGNAFNVDAVRGNGRTWDFEGLSLTTSISPSAKKLSAGDELTVSGRVWDGAGRVTGDPLILQSRPRGAGAWTDISPLTYMDPKGFSRATVTVTETQELRWLRPESQYADAGTSESVRITVTPGRAESTGTEPPRSGPVDGPAGSSEAPADPTAAEEAQGGAQSSQDAAGSLPEFPSGSLNGGAPSSSTDGPADGPADSSTAPDTQGDGLSNPLPTLPAAPTGGSTDAGAGGEPSGSPSNSTSDSPGNSPGSSLGSASAEQSSAPQQEPTTSPPKGPAPTAPKDPAPPAPKDPAPSPPKDPAPSPPKDPEPPAPKDPAPSPPKDPEPPAPRECPIDPPLDGPVTDGPVTAPTDVPTDCPTRVPAEAPVGPPADGPVGAMTNASPEALRNEPTDAPSLESVEVPAG